VSEYVSVALPVPLEKEFHYHVPPRLQAALEPGLRVLVPFAGRKLAGFATKWVDAPDVPDTKDVIAVLDTKPLLGETMLRLAAWIARYYACGPGEVLEAMVPAPVRHGSASRRVLRVFPAAPATALEAERDRRRGRFARQADVLDVVLGADAAEGILLGDVLSLSHARSASPVRTLARAGLVRLVASERPPEPAPAYGETERTVVLNEEQEAALGAICERIASGGFETFLLHGVTGSGKTEVYLRAIAEAVKLGRQAIVLVPEIALTPQTLGRFRRRFDRVAVLHSQLSDAERSLEWTRIRSGEADVVVGPRSAVFAPVPRLGLLVVDEEQETSFKQQNAPRYHARDVGVYRASLEGAPVVLGSATPSLESHHNALVGKYRRLVLSKRVDDLPLPIVEVVDPSREPGHALSRGDAAPRPKKPRFLSRRLQFLVEEKLRKREQVILFLNRRGHSTYLTCLRCGWVLHCTACEITLTFHKIRKRAICHYCYREVEAPRACPDCKDGVVRFLGAGTEKIEEELAEFYPDARVARMDSDTMRRQHSHALTLESFRKGEIQILVGTQMIAKGLDFPNVTLVGIVSADTTMNLPDFRATERTFQLVSQVAGRTGRGERPGRVIVQTLRPDHFCIRAAERHDYATFAEHELLFRKALRYPPFSHLMRVVFEGREEAHVQLAAAAYREKIEPRARECGAEILGPAPAAIPRIDRDWRYQLLVKAESGTVLYRIHRGEVPASRRGGLKTILDVDPVGTM
jgi:primosomal protein N' (replication factor Y) (superfamily II helicase)